MSDNLVDLRGNRAINAHALSLVKRVLGHSLSDSGKKKKKLVDNFVLQTSQKGKLC